MATLAKAHGNTVAPAEEIGRNPLWVGVLCGDAVLNDLVPILEDGNIVDSSYTYLDRVRQVVDIASSITITGGNTTTAVMFLTEGFGFADTDTDGNAPTLQEQAEALRVQLLAVGGEGEATHLGTIEVTFEDLTGLVFVAAITAN